MTGPLWRDPHIPPRPRGLCPAPRWLWRLLRGGARPGLGAEQRPGPPSRRCAFNAATPPPPPSSGPGGGAAKMAESGGAEFAAERPSR